jgi:hypothetical protein
LHQRRFLEGIVRNSTLLNGTRRVVTATAAGRFGTTTPAHAAGAWSATFRTGIATGTSQYSHPSPLVKWTSVTGQVTVFTTTFAIHLGHLENGVDTVCGAACPV